MKRDEILHRHVTLRIHPTLCMHYQPQLPPKAFLVLKPITSSPRKNATEHNQLSLSQNFEFCKTNQYYVYSVLGDRVAL